jgi:predicted glycosyltransferase
MTNSPHVLFFTPIIADLTHAGHEVTVTARHYAQTLDLLEMRGIEATVIGQHRGRSLVKKARGLAARSMRLAAFGAGRGFDVAVSHNSNDLAVAAWMLRIPQVIIGDYEHATLAYKITTRLATRVMFPDAIPTEAFMAHGVSRERIVRFAGLKEHVYLGDEPADQPIREMLGIGVDEIMALLRPPATMSTYHRFGNALFDAVVDRCATTPGVRTVVVPRTAEQAAALRPTMPEGAILIEHALDGPSLVTQADLVVSAGGTMNREAAVLGTPAYTVFAGTLGAVDAELIRRGLLTRVTAADGVILEPKPVGRAGWSVENRPLILAEIEDLGASRAASRTRKEG